MNGEFLVAVVSGPGVRWPALLVAGSWSDPPFGARRELQVLRLGRTGARLGWVPVVRVPPDAALEWKVDGPGRRTMSWDDVGLSVSGRVRRGGGPVVLPALPLGGHDVRVRGWGRRASVEIDPGDAPAWWAGLAGRHRGVLVGTENIRPVTALLGVEPSTVRPIAPPVAPAGRALSAVGR